MSAIVQSTTRRSHTSTTSMPRSGDVPRYPTCEEGTRIQLVVHHEGTAAVR